MTEKEFLAFAEIARHECEDYYILGKSELYYDGPATELMEYEVIDVMLIDEDIDPYHEVLQGHQGKPYYVPDKRSSLPTTILSIGKAPRKRLHSETFS